MFTDIYTRACAGQGEDPNFRVLSGGETRDCTAFILFYSYSDQVKTPKKKEETWWVTITKSRQGSDDTEEEKERKR